jgi:hypothetical protein
MCKSPSPSAFTESWNFSLILWSIIIFAKLRAFVKTVGYLLCYSGTDSCSLASLCIIHNCIPQTKFISVRSWNHSGQAMEPITLLGQVLPKKSHSLCKMCRCSTWHEVSLWSCPHVFVGLVPHAPAVFLSRTHQLTLLKKSRELIHKTRKQHPREISQML